MDAEVGKATARLVGRPVGAEEPLLSAGIDSLGAPSLQSSWCDNLHMPALRWLAANGGECIESESRIVEQHNMRRVEH